MIQLILDTFLDFFDPHVTFYLQKWLSLKLESLWNVIFKLQLIPENMYFKV